MAFVKFNYTHSTAMATVSAFSSLRSIPTPQNTYKTPSYPLFTLPIRTTTRHGVSISNTCKHSPFLKNNVEKVHSDVVGKLRSVEEETAVIEREVQEGVTEQQPVSVPVSPSDTLTMFFQAEGTMNEAGIPRVTKALEETGGVANIKVQVLEGIASVELTKETTVQSTGVASGLVEMIQGSGFKLQALNLSFQDEEDLLV